MAKVAQIWKEMTTEEKQVYKEKAVKANERMIEKWEEMQTQTAALADPSGQAGNSESSSMDSTSSEACSSEPSTIKGFINSRDMSSSS